MIDKNALIEFLRANWQQMESLALTKSREPTSPQGHFTTNKNGDPVHNPPVKFSLLGAIMHLYGDTILIRKSSACYSALLTAFKGARYNSTYLATWESTKGRKIEDIIALVESANWD